MSTHVGTGSHPSRSVLRDLAWRVVLVALAALAVVIGLPAWIRTPLSAAAAIMTALFFARRYGRRRLLDTLLTVIGGGVVVLILLGLLLNLSPQGLSGASWAIGVGVIEVTVLAVLAVFRPTAAAPARTRRSLPVGPAVWAMAIAAVLSGALVWSVVSFGSNQIEPLALAAKPAGDSVVLTVTSGRAEGPFELDLVTVAGRTVLARAIRVRPGAGRSTSVTLPAATRGLVQLVPVGSSRSVRELILDSTSAGRATR